ncbi:hypothetical protein RFI_23588, partial [Reticulomyxa filosa]
MPKTTQKNLDRNKLFLKICGREEYLWYKDNERVMSSSYVRHLIRNDEVNTSLRFVLLYVVDLDEALKQVQQHISEQQKCFSSNQCYPDYLVDPKSRKQFIPYENEGYSCIVPALIQSIANKDRYTVHLWHFVEHEYQWYIDNVNS